jgi:hypothetical protein
VQTTSEPTSLSPLAEQARALYDTRLKTVLEPQYLGQAVAIRPDTGNYAVGPTHSKAAAALLARHQPDGRIVTLTIGPPTDADLRLTALRRR